MSDNPQYGTQSDFALPQFRVLAIAGRDAVAFAQAQFMNDLAPLGDGVWQWNGWLDPKGRVRALFALLRRDAETLWLVTVADLESLASELGRFVFRSKARIGILPLTASGRLDRSGTAQGAIAGLAGDSVELDFSGDGGARTLVLGPARGTATDAELEAQWWSLDLAHGWPALPEASLAGFTPQQLSLQRLNAFSVKKGCYPGQEIVARTHFLGKAKRGLAGLRAVNARAGDPVLDAAGRTVGEIVCVAGADALAVVPLEPADLSITVGGRPVGRLELAGGLAR